MVFISNAEWPSNVYTDMYGEHVSADIHGTKEQAEEACILLQKEGFGGMREHFPIRVWVTEQ